METTDELRPREGWDFTGSMGEAGNRDMAVRRADIVSGMIADGGRILGWGQLLSDIRTSDRREYTVIAFATLIQDGIIEIDRDNPQIAQVTDAGREWFERMLTAPEEEIYR